MGVECKGRRQAYSGGRLWPAHAGLRACHALRALLPASASPRLCEQVVEGGEDVRLDVLLALAEAGDERGGQQGHERGQLVWSRHDGGGQNLRGWDGGWSRGEGGQRRRVCAWRSNSLETRSHSFPVPLLSWVLLSLLFPPGLPFTQFLAHAIRAMPMHSPASASPLPPRAEPSRRCHHRPSSPPLPPLLPPSAPPPPLLQSCRRRQRSSGRRQGSAERCGRWRPHRRQPRWGSGAGRTRRPGGEGEGGVTGRRLIRAAQLNNLEACA